MSELRKVLNIGEQLGGVLGKGGSYLNSVQEEVKGKKPEGIMSLPLHIFLGGLCHTES